MGLEIGARILKDGVYCLTPIEPFKGINFLNEHGEMRCTQFVREALNFCGINFYNIDSFIALTPERTSGVLKLIKVFQQMNTLDKHDRDVLNALIRLLEVSHENNFYVTIG